MGAGRTVDKGCVHSQNVTRETHVVKHSKGTTRDALRAMSRLLP